MRFVSDDRGKRPSDRRPGSGPLRPARAEERKAGDAPRFPLPPGVGAELDHTAGRTLDAKFYLSKAIEAILAGDISSAVTEAARAKEAAPRSPTVREAYGVSLYAAGRFKDALAELQAFRRMTGSTIHDPQIADCYRAVGRPVRAIEFLESASPATPSERMKIALVRAGAMADTGDRAGAQAALNLADLAGQEIRPPGFLPVGSVGSTADTRRRKTGTRSERRTER